MNTSLTAKEFVLRNAVLSESFAFVGREQPIFIDISTFFKAHGNKM